MTDRRPTKRHEVILFDLGGVLLHLREIGGTFGIAGEERDFHRAWLMSPSVREFESGGIVADEFATRIVRELQLPYGPTEFLRRFDSWPERLYDGVSDLLGGLSRDYTVAILSNTNALHWGREDIAGVIEPLIDHAFLSYRTGLLKPDRSSFELVTDHFQCKPDDVLFLDDNPLNIEAADSFGYDACLTRGISDVRGALTARGILPSGPFNRALH